MSFVRKSMLVAGGQVASLGCSVVTGVLFSRALRANGMGQYELFRNLSVLASTIGTLGVGQAAIYFLNQKRVSSEQVVTDFLRVGLIAGVASGVILAFVLRYWSGFYGEISLIPLVVFCIAVASLILRNLLRPVLVSKLAARQMVIVDVLQYAVQLGAGIALLLGGMLSTPNGIALYGLGVIASSAILLWYLRHDIQPRLSVRWPVLVEIGKYGMKLGAVTLIAVLSGTASVMILRFYRPEDFADVGLYTRALAVTNLVMLLPRAVGPMLYSKWSGSSSDIVPQVEMVSRLHCVYGLLVAIVLLVGGKYVLWLLYGHEFIAANHALQILGFATAIQAVFDPINNLLASRGKAGHMIVILAISSAVQLVSSAILVRHYGSQGAALGMLLAAISALVNGMLVSHKLYGVSVRRCFLPQIQDFRLLLSALRTRSPERMDSTSLTPLGE